LEYLNNTMEVSLKSCSSMEIVNWKGKSPWVWCMRMTKEK
jgi:hypothetical protein